MKFVDKMYVRLRRVVGFVGFANLGGDLTQTAMWCVF
jgi:hypothetical protein